MTTLIQSQFAKTAITGSNRTNNRVMGGSFIANYKDTTEIFFNQARLSTDPRFSDNIIRAVIHRTIGITVISGILEKDHGVNFKSVDKIADIQPSDAQTVRARAHPVITVIQDAIDAVGVNDIPKPNDYLIFIHPDDVDNWVAALNDSYSKIGDQAAREVKKGELLMPELFASMLLDYLGDSGLALATNTTIITPDMAKNLGLTDVDKDVYCARVRDGKASSLPNVSTLCIKGREASHAFLKQQYTDRDVRKVVEGVVWKDSNLIGVMLKNMIGSKPVPMTLASVLNDLHDALVRDFGGTDVFHNLLTDAFKLLKRTKRTDKKRILPIEKNVKSSTSNQDLLNRKVNLMSEGSKLGSVQRHTSNMNIPLGLATTLSRNSTVFTPGANRVDFGPQSRELITSLYTMDKTNLSIDIPKNLPLIDHMGDYVKGTRYPPMSESAHLSISDFFDGVEITEGGHTMFAILKSNVALDVFYPMANVLTQHSGDLSAQRLVIHVPKSTGDEAQALVSGAKTKSSDPVLLSVWATSKGEHSHISFLEEVARDYFSSQKIFIVNAIPKIEFGVKSKTLIQFMTQHDSNYRSYAPDSKQSTKEKAKPSARVLEFIPLAYVLANKGMYDPTLTNVTINNEYAKFLDEVADDFINVREHNGFKPENLLNALNYMIGVETTKSFLTFETEINGLRSMFSAFVSPVDIAYILAILVSKLKSIQKAETK